MKGSNPRNDVDLSNLNAKPAFVGRTSTGHWHFLPKAALKYDFGQRGNAYVSVSRGYRSGGYNVQVFSDLLQTEMSRQMMAAIDAGTEAYLTKLFGHIPNMPAGHVDMIMGRIRDKMPSIERPDVTTATYYKPETAWN